MASELEARWDAALSRVKGLEEKLRKFETSVDSSEFRLEDFTRLADDVAEVWNSPGTYVRLKKRIRRTLIEEIFVDTDSGTGELQLLIHWRGGTHNECGFFDAEFRISAGTFRNLAVLFFLAAICGRCPRCL